MHTIYHSGVLGMKWGHRKAEAEKTYAIPSKKSAHRVRLEAKYLKKGASNMDAEQQAANRMHGEKVALAIAGSAAAAGAAYIVSRELGKRFTGVNLEVGKELHYINALGDQATYDRRLYASFQKGDTAKYKGLLATALRKNASNTTIYDTVLGATENIKAPSQHEAKKCMMHLQRLIQILLHIQIYRCQDIMR